MADAFEQLSRGIKKLSEKAQKAMSNPKLNRVEKAIRAALEEAKTHPKNSNIAAFILARGLEALRKDLDELEITNKSDRQIAEITFKEKFEQKTMGLGREAIFASFEGKKLKEFFTSYAESIKMDKFIAEYERNNPKNPILKAALVSAPLLKAAFIKWFNEGKKGERKAKPSGTKEQVAKADAVSGAKDKAKKKKKVVKKKIAKTKDENKTGKKVAAKTAKPSSHGSKTEVRSAGSVKYEINPDYTKTKLSPEEFKRIYLSIKDRKKRNEFVLAQVAAGNVNNVFERLEAKGNTGMKVRMEVDQNGLRVADTDVQLDGPTAMAAAMLSGCTLPTDWESKKTLEYAKSNKGTVKFIMAPDIAKALNIDWNNDKPNGKWMMSAEFALKRDEMIKKWRKDHNISNDKLAAGYFKDIVHPASRKDMLEIYGGVDVNGKRVQGLSIENRHGPTYSDYSHQLRRIKNHVTIINNDGTEKRISLAEFHASEKYAKEFGFPVMQLGTPYITPELQKFVDANKIKEKTS